MRARAILNVVVDFKSILCLYHSVYNTFNPVWMGRAASVIIGSGINWREGFPDTFGVASLVASPPIPTHAPQLRIPHHIHSVTLSCYYPHCRKIIISDPRDANPHLTMADEEHFSLCWNNFTSNLSTGFHESLCRGDLVDVTLVAEGRMVKAHRLVLSVCSPLFRDMFAAMTPNQQAFGEYRHTLIAMHRNAYYN